MTINPIAYFCAEYGLTHELPLYAGGLGILAGDTLKQAVDSKVPMVAFGLLYRGDQIRQVISVEGWQTEEDRAYDPVTMGFEHVYLDDQPFFVKVKLADDLVWLRTWKRTLSNDVVLYLLDADTDQNHPHFRSLTRQLYFGDDTYQLEQQILLGVGSLKLLTALGMEPPVFHLNEGRSALLHWQLVLHIMKTENCDYYTARERAISKTVYTNHTLVAAGNKQYDAEVVKKYAEPYAKQAGVSAEELIIAGLVNPGSFSVTDYALNISRRANGVSQLHTKLSSENWPQYQWVNVTNGVHLPTWQAPQFRELNSTLDEKKSINPDDSRDPSATAKPSFKLIDELPNDALWQKRITLKNQAQEFVKSRTGYGYDPNQLVVGWARRLAGYKRLDALFADVERLRAIIRHQQRPIQLLVAGKVHQGNDDGKASLQKVIQYMQKELSGQALFVPDYDMEVASHLTRGVDVWLNTPEYGREACGTSGMKAISNGVLQCSVKDGWLAEVDLNNIGWELNSDDISNSVYETLENLVAPEFYANKVGGEANSGIATQIPGEGPAEQPPDVPIGLSVEFTTKLPAESWFQKMRNALKLSSQFSAEVMLENYLNKLYN